jgi:long-chain acyl-CoA synthetase
MGSRRWRSCNPGIVWRELSVLFHLRARLRSVEVEATNLADLLTGWAATDGERVAMIERVGTRRALTWAELERRVGAVAAGLVGHGLVAGHRVGILGPNSVEFVGAYLGAIRAGLVVVPLNPECTAVEVAAMVRDSGAKVIFAPADPQLPGVAWVALTPDGLDGLASADPTEVDSPQDPEALAVLLYTAGTSAGPKAAMITHRALLSHLAHIQQLGVVDRDTVIMAMLPLFHVFGLNAVLGSWLTAGATMVVTAGWDGMLEAVIEEHVTNLPVAPAVLARLLRDGHTGRLGQIDTVLSGAAPLPDELRAEFTDRTGLRVDQGYGLTEASPGVTVTFGGELLGSGHVGRALPGVELRIGDGSDPAEPAEIWIRGANLFSGYWPDGQGGPGSDGWFPSGDIGYLSDGELFLVDRARELIIVNGFNVYPGEVEGAVAELPGVGEVAVIGAPDARTGEQVVAFVTGSAVTEQQVMDHCAGRLARFKRPAVVRLIDELPRGATGKVQKGILREVLAADATAGRTAR